MTEDRVRRRTRKTERVTGSPLPTTVRAMTEDRVPTLMFCRDCGHWEHDPGSCDGLGHVWNELDIPVVTECKCEVHDDQRAQPAAEYERLGSEAP